MKSVTIIRMEDGVSSMEERLESEGEEDVKWIESYARLKVYGSKAVLIRVVETDQLKKRRKEWEYSQISSEMKYIRNSSIIGGKV